MGSFGRRLESGIESPVGVVASGLNSGCDALKTTGNFLTNLGTIITNTAEKAKEVISGSWSGKWYNKVYQVPLAIGISGLVIAEGAVRGVLNPLKNAFLNVCDTGGNLFKNIYSSLRHAFSKTRPVSDVSFESLKLKSVSNKYFLSKLAWWNKQPVAAAA